MAFPQTQSVALIQCKSYTDNVLDVGVAAALDTLDFPSNLNGSTVLLKPNLISSRGPALACTNANYLAALVRWLTDHGAKIIIGDSPAFGNTVSVMERQGMMAPLKGLPFQQVQFSTPVKRALSNGITVEVAAEAFECDVFINLPKLKAHNQMFMTGAVKNIFGIVVGIRKAMLHMRHGSDHGEFSDILIRLPELLPKSFHLLDGIEAMHVSGPIDGEKISLCCIGASRCPVALDTAVLEMLELPLINSPLWKVAAEMGHPGSSAEQISYPLADPCQFHGSGFVAPGSLNAVRFNPFRLISGMLRRLRLAFGS